MRKKSNGNNQSKKKIIINRTEVMKSAGYEAIVNTKRIWMVLVLVMNRLY